MRTTRKKATKKTAIPSAPSPAFWLVWRDGTDRYNNVPTYKHETLKSATAEAERLSRGNPGARFYVLPAHDYVIAEVLPPAWKTGGVDDSDEPPF